MLNRSVERVFNVCLACCKKDACFESGGARKLKEALHEAFDFLRSSERGRQRLRFIVIVISHSVISSDEFAHRFLYLIYVMPVILWELFRGGLDERRM